MDVCTPRPIVALGTAEPDPEAAQGPYHFCGPPGSGRLGNQQDLNGLNGQESGDFSPPHTKGKLAPPCGGPAIWETPAGGRFN